MRNLDETFTRHMQLMSESILPVNEIFLINRKDKFKSDLIEFLKQEFSNGNLISRKSEISTTEYKSDDWYEPMADDIINDLAKYFETVRSQTEKNINPDEPLVTNNQ